MKIDKETGEVFLGDAPVKKSFTARGAEILDTTPMELPLGYKPQESMDEKLRRIVREEVSDAASRHGLETFEEADDFVVDDADDFLPSQYQLTDMQEERMLVPRSKEGRKDAKISERRRGGDDAAQRGRELDRDGKRGGGEPGEGVKAGGDSSGVSKAGGKS